MRLFAFAVLLLLSTCGPAQTTTVPLEPAAWDFGAADHEFVTYQGRQALRINTGTGPTGGQIVRVNELTFTNGTLDFDLALADSSFFTTVYFRLQDDENTEHVYLRAFFADHPRAGSAVQYAAVVDGVNYWDVSHEYQGAADFRKERWIPIRLIVRDEQLLVYVSDMDRPALYIPVLDGGFESGSIGFDGIGWIANLTVTPDATPGLAPGRGYDPTHNDPRYLRQWQVSAPVDFPFGREPVAADLPGENAEWTDLTAERHGLVNLSRRFGATAPDSRRLVWLRTTVTADEAQRRRLDFGYSDEVYVYLNGTPLYQGKNLYNTPSMKAPGGRASIENSRIEVALVEGENELLIGVTNFFFAWGIVGRWDDGAGLRY